MTEMLPPQRIQSIGLLSFAAILAALAAGCGSSAPAAEPKGADPDFSIRSAAVAAAFTNPTVVLTPVAEGDGDPVELRLAGAGEPYALLRLQTGRSTTVSGVRVRLRDRDGGEIWASEVVASDAEGVVPVLVPSTLLSPGLVGVELEGPATARYRLRVVAGAG